MDYEVNHPGQVKGTRCLKINNIAASKGCVFTVKYYRDVLDEGKGNKVKYYTRYEFLPLLIVREEIGTYESDYADDRSSKEDISDWSSDITSGSEISSNSYGTA